MAVIWKGVTGICFYEHLDGVFLSSAIALGDIDDVVFVSLAYRNES